MKQSFINRMLMMLVLLLGATSAASAADRFYIEGVNIEPGEIKTLVFNLDNDQTFYGFQAEIRLPEGLEIVTKADGKADATLSSRCQEGYSLFCNMVDVKTVRLGTFSLSHAPITGNSGALLYLKVKASDNFSGGELVMSDILFVNAADNDVRLPDFSIELGATHYNIFYIPDFKISVGETKTISLVLDNETPFSAFQTDLYLSEGLRIVASSLQLTSRAGRGHSVSVKSFTDGRTRIICMSTSNENFSGDNGALLNLGITADKNVAETAIIEMRNQIFSKSDAKEFVLPDSRTIVTTERALVSGITLDYSSIGLIVGDTRILNATVYPAYASTKEIEWSSSNPEVAVVSQAGQVTAIGIGEAVITAMAADGSGVKAECAVSVSGIPVSTIILHCKSTSMKVGDTISLPVTVYPANATDKSLVWTSSDTAIAVVDEAGNVTAVGLGEVSITASSVSNPEINAICAVTVVPTPVSEIILDPTSVSIEAGQSVDLIAEVMPVSATDKSLLWSSENPEIATVSESGKITAIATGTTDIIATAADGSGVSARCRVNVVPTPAESIVINTPACTEFKVGETIALSATVLPGNATDKSVTWASGDESVAVVDINGVVTAVSVGEVVIYATNSAGQTAEIILVVKPTPAASISIVPDVLTLRAGGTATLIYTVLPVTTTDKSVTWKSSDPDVVAVDNEGSVRAIAVGSAVVTVTTADGSAISATCAVTVEPTPATAIEIVYDGATELEVGQTALLSAVVSPDDATDKSVSWVVGNAEVLTVDETGMVTAVALGESWVGAINSSGQMSKISFKVVPTKVTGITLSNTSLTLKDTESAQLTFLISPDNATDKTVTWVSSSPEVATVDNSGGIKALEVGETEITAIANGGDGVSATCHVSVIPTPATSITINQEGSVECKAGDKINLSATVLPENATDKSVIWRSDAENIATVSDRGVVTAIAVGEVKIYAINSAGQSDHIVIRVTPTLAQSIILNRTTAALKVSGTLQLSAAFIPETTTNKSVEWSSSNPGVASVDQTGLVTALQLGECRVTVRATDGSGATASCDVTVGETAAESIEITPKGSFTLNIGEKMQFAATVLPETTTDKSVTWRSQTECVAVDQNGLVTAISAVENNRIIATNSAGQTAEVDITVLPMKVSSIVLSSNSIQLRAGEVFTLIAYVSPLEATDQSLNWSSSNPEVATVDNNGNILAKKVGESIITVSANDGSGVTARCHVSVVPTPVEEVLLQYTGSTNLKAGETLALTAVVKPDDATDKTVIWTSTNPSVASVHNGTVTALSIGNTVIKASAGDKSASVEITVVPTLIESIELTAKFVNIEVGQSESMGVLIGPSTATNMNFEWTSDHPEIVSVDKGCITGIAIGQAVVTVWTTDGSNLSDSCTVSVIPTLPTSVEIVYEGLTRLMVGETVQLSARVLPDNTTDKSVIWSVENPDIIEVSDHGLVTALNLGNSWVGVTDMAGNFAKIDFEIIPTLVESIEILKDGDTLHAGESMQLTAVVYPDSATDKSVDWESSAPEIISVDNNGLLVAHKVGRADIKATAKDGSGIYAVTTVVVAVTDVEAILITPNGSTELKDGETLQLTATVLPENATYPNVCWESTDLSKASVDYTGFVTAHSDLGDVDIIATSGDVSAKITLTIVETPVEGVYLSVYTGGASQEIIMGEDVDLLATIYPWTATDQSLTFTSSDESIIKITNFPYPDQCTINGVGPGDAYITATSSNGVSGNILITVKPILIESIALPERLELEIGKQYDIIPEISPENASIKNLHWVSSNESVVMMWGDKLYATGQGEATLTCYTMDGSDLSASCQITVVRYASSITISEHDLTLMVGDSFALTAEIEPFDTTSKEVVWESSDEDVVIVDNTGLIEALSEGSAIVSVRTRYYPWATDECLVTVNKDTGVETISIDDINIRVENHHILLDGLNWDVPVSLIGIDGNVLISQRAKEPCMEIEVEQSGIYVVKVGKYALKLRINR